MLFLIGLGVTVLFSIISAQQVKSKYGKELGEHMLKSNPDNMPSGSVSPIISLFVLAGYLMMIVGAIMFFAGE